LSLAASPSGMPTEQRRKIASRDRDPSGKPCPSRRGGWPVTIERNRDVGSMKRRDCRYWKAYRTSQRHDKRGGFHATKREKAPPTIHHGPVIRANLELLADRRPGPLECVPAPLATRARTKPSPPKPRNATPLRRRCRPGRGQRKRRGGRSPVCRRRRARFARRIFAQQPARRWGAARAPGASRGPRLAQNSCASTQTSRAARPPLRRRRPARAHGDPVVALA
jgi:hypothetical protein